jgi:2-polyprenyl-3-methyl-5-hydroxy-6-metoxy-1,4-benzoquinol methylase
VPRVFFYISPAVFAEFYFIRKNKFNNVCLKIISSFTSSLREDRHMETHGVSGIKNPSYQYRLEKKEETHRLEEQSRVGFYDIADDIRELALDLGDRSPKHILDAGCGSGVGARELAKKFDQAQVFAVDGSRQRIEQAQLYLSAKPVHYFSNDLRTLTHVEGLPKFDLVFCRYVLQHFSSANQSESVIEVLIQLRQLLSPQGQVYLIDMDGPLFNLFPQTEKLQSYLNRIEAQASFDMQIGRKLPSLLKRAGFRSVEVKAKCLYFSGERLSEEIRLMTDRFEHLVPYFAEVLGSQKDAADFVDLYLDQMSEDGASLFYNQFKILTGV